MRKVLYSACFGSDAYPFHHMAEKVQVVRDANQMTEKDSLLVVWGGADINPALYGHKKSITTHFHEARDEVEWACIKKAIAMGIPMLGVCRGAQMMCAAAGGFLIQDVRGHAGYGGHTITTFDGRVMRVNSLHHQMLGLTDKVDHELLAWTTNARSVSYIWKDDLVYTPPKGFKEPEMVYFPKIKALAVQWHPEMMSDDEPATNFVMEQWNARFTRETSES